MLSAVCLPCSFGFGCLHLCVFSCLFLTRIGDNTRTPCQQQQLTAFVESTRAFCLRPYKLVCTCVHFLQELHLALVVRPTLHTLHQWTSVCCAGCVCEADHCFAHLHVLAASNAADLLQVIAASITSNDQSAIHQQIIKLQNEVERLLV